MTREESIIRARRAARGYGQQEGKRSLAGVLTTQVLICIILFGGVMSARGIAGVRDNVKHYLNYSVDCKATVGEIVDRVRSALVVMGDA